MFILQCLLSIWFFAALAMSAALTKHYPGIAGWGNVSRSIAWPVTLYEVHLGQLDE